MTNTVQPSPVACWPPQDFPQGFDLRAEIAGQVQWLRLVCTVVSLPVQHAKVKVSVVVIEISRNSATRTPYCDKMDMVTLARPSRV